MDIVQYQSNFKFSLMHKFILFIFFNMIISQIMENNIICCLLSYMLDISIDYAKFGNSWQFEHISGTFGMIIHSIIPAKATEFWCFYRKTWVGHANIILNMINVFLLTTQRARVVTIYKVSLTHISDDMHIFFFIKNAVVWNDGWLNCCQILLFLNGLAEDLTFWMKNCMWIMYSPSMAITTI